jgi:hypothetical protein
VVGTWNVTSSCIKVSGNMDLNPLGLMCTSAPITGSLAVTGTWTAKSDGTYSDNTATTGDLELALPASCLEISGTVTTCDRIAMAMAPLGFATITCADAASGSGCTCKGSVDQTGWGGLVTLDAVSSGRYTTGNNELTLDGTAKYSYCVSGKTMNWTPKGIDGTTVLTGTITLQNGSSGSGGSGGGAGGGAGAGGARTGGTTGSGGAPTGGTTTASGGATPSGGTVGSGGTTPTGGTTSSGGTSGTRGTGPCDIYKAANNPCVAAYSMVRALSSTYSGPLFQVRSPSSTTNQGTGGTTTDIGMLGDGYADTAAVDKACGSSTCTVSILYDQSGNGNDIKRAPKGNTSGGATGAEDDYESPANKGPVTAGGHKVYTLYMSKHEGYRTAVGVKGKGMPLGTAAQGIYELADGKHFGSPCCWDFGNVTTDPTKYGVMNTLFFGVAYWGRGAGSGPWFMADFEAGVWAGGSKQGDPGWGSLDGAASSPANSNNPSLAVDFAFGILKTDPSKYALRMANVQTANDVTTAYEGNLPKAMDNLGGIVLGVGGDNSNNAWSTFYEGAIVSGYPSTATDLAVMQNGKAVGYTK